MRVVLDTNVLISAIFFSGTPSRILAAWIEEEFELVVWTNILECALGRRANCVVSGDRALLRTSG